MKVYWTFKKGAVGGLVLDGILDQYNNIHPQRCTEYDQILLDIK